MLAGLDILPASLGYMLYHGDILRFRCILSVKGEIMKNVLIVLVAVFSLNAFAETHTESLEKEILVLKSIIQKQEELQHRPMCLPTGARCESQFDICCSDGQYCFIGAICR